MDQSESPLRRRDLIALLSSAIIGWPLAAYGQQKRIAVVGFLGAGHRRPFEPLLTGFRQGLSELGFVEGQNLAIEYRFAEGHYDALAILAGDLVDRRVDLIAVVGGISARAAKNASSTMPIVFSVGVDPVGEGLVASFARPGGNLTGIATLYTEMLPKRFELLSELAPRARTIGLLVNPKNPLSERLVADAQAVARDKRVLMVVLKASTENELGSAFDSVAQLGVGALIIGADAFFNSNRAQLGAMSLSRAVPAIYELREFAVAGGLASYAPRLSALHRELGIYAAKILKGAKPADLPIEQPTEFDLVINLKTAKALGLTVPQSLLARADEVIE